MSDEAPETPPEAPAEETRFDEAYVVKLREENASRRHEAKESRLLAEKAQRAALELAISSYATVLKDPTDLLAYADPATLVGEDGLPDPDRIRASALDLIERKPHLDGRRPEGDIDQGRRGEVAADQFDFSGMLRRAAG